MGVAQLFKTNNISTSNAANANFFNSDELIIDDPAKYKHFKVQDSGFKIHLYVSRMQNLEP
jgi:hypothetical protein